MILTEAEAATKVCPFLSARGAETQEVTKCLTSDCMAWRWAPMKSPEDIASRKNWAHIPDTNPAEPKGYCKA